MRLIPGQPFHAHAPAHHSELQASGHQQADLADPPALVLGNAERAEVRKVGARYRERHLEAK